jgi:predicted nucleic acid-binding protein
MPTDEVFIDATALLAIVNRADALHSSAVALHRKFSASKTPLVTSDWVLAEFLGGASRPPLRASAMGMVAALKSSSRMTVIEATRADWERAFTFFCDHHDKSWSLIDCTSMLICRDRGIQRVFTYDHHFRQFGLSALLRNDGI